MSDLRIKDIDEGEIDTILADDIDFTGALSFTKPLMIKGRFQGEIDESGELYIGDDAHIEAKVSAAVVSLKGSLKGDIEATSRVELFSTAVVEGDISAPDVVMESGCRFNGMCRMSIGGKSGEAESTERQGEDEPESPEEEYNA